MKQRFMMMTPPVVGGGSCFGSSSILSYPLPPDRVNACSGFISGPVEDPSRGADPTLDSAIGSGFVHNKSLPHGYYEVRGFGL